MNKQHLFLFLFLALTTISWAQENIESEDDVPRINYNNTYLLQTQEKKLYSFANDFHTSVRPFRGIDLVDYITPESAHQDYEGLPNTKKWQNILFHRDLIKYSGTYRDHFYDIRVNPLMNFEFLSKSQESNLGTPFRNTRGIQILGQLGERFTFQADLRENQIRLPEYARINSVERDNVVPGMGRPQHITPAGVFDFSTSSGYFQYRSKSFFTFEFGTGKNFIGEGHRSLLLSDNAPNYPYLKIQTDIGKIRYQNLYTKQINLSGSSSDVLHDIKYTSTHYLSLNLGKRFNLGLFESVIWDGEKNVDGKQNRGYELAFLNPIIFYRSVEHAIGSGGGNVLMGANTSFKLSERSMLYGQVVLDELKVNELFSSNGWWGNKFGIQGGFKSFDLFRIRNLNLLTEFNLVRPFTYAHKSGNTNYGHYGQELAHPLGANFVEFLAKGSYQYKRLRFTGHVMYAIKGYETRTKEGGLINNGSNIYTSYDDKPLGDHGYSFLNGQKGTTLFAKGTVGYIINPSYNLMVEAGLGFRNFTPEIETPNFQATKTTFISFGLKTNLFNHYYDF
jgi:hypothetical protein